MMKLPLSRENKPTWCSMHVRIQSATTGHTQQFDVDVEVGPYGNVIHAMHRLEAAFKAALEEVP